MYAADTSDGGYEPPTQSFQNMGTATGAKSTTTGHSVFGMSDNTSEPHLSINDEMTASQR